MNKSLKEFILESMILESNDPTNARTDVQEIFTMIIFSMFASGHFRKIGNAKKFKEIVTDKVYSYLNREDNTNTESDESLSILYDIIEKVNTKLTHFKKTLKSILNDNTWVSSYFYQMGAFSEFMEKELNNRKLEEYYIIQHNTGIRIPLISTHYGNRYAVGEDKVIRKRVTSHLEACMKYNRLVSKKKDKVNKADIYIIHKDVSSNRLKEFISIEEEIEYWNKLVREKMIFPISIKKLNSDTSYFPINIDNKLSFDTGDEDNKITGITFNPITTDKFGDGEIDFIKEFVSNISEWKAGESSLVELFNVSDERKNVLESICDKIIGGKSKNPFMLTSTIELKAKLLNTNIESEREYVVSIKSNSTSNGKLIQNPTVSLSAGVTVEIAIKRGTANMGKIVDYLKSRNIGGDSLDNFKSDFEEVFGEFNVNESASIMENDIYLLIGEKYEALRNILNLLKSNPEELKDIDDNVKLLLGYLMKWYKVVNRQIAYFNKIFNIAKRNVQKGNAADIKSGVVEVLCGGVIDAWGQNPVSLPVYVLHNM